MTKPTAALFAMIAVAAVVPAVWSPAEVSGTAEQQMACTQDAFRFCSSEVPDVARVTACMTRNLKKLSPLCRAQFR